MQFHIEKYTEARKEMWNAFVKNSKNATFLLQRGFMEYHKDRFEDYSLLVFQDNKLVAVLPANKAGNALYSHQGLTYGGLVFSGKIKLEQVLKIYQNILQFLVSEGFEQLILKPTPKIYHSFPSDEIDYLLFLTEAKLIKREISAAIENFSRIKIPTSQVRKRGIKRAQKENLLISEEKIFDPFWNKILIPNLAKTHHTKPVHTAEEMQLLANKFPRNIRQFSVFKDEKIVAGTTIFETEQVAHVQYISGNEEKQQLGSLDFLFEHLINNVFKHKKYFDFGSSNEEAGKKLNSGLMYWKESFGARSISQDTYEIDPKKYINLQNVLV